MRKSLKKIQRKAAVFDIDGTLFRSSLLIEITEALVQERAFPPQVRNVYWRAYKNWHERKGSYDDYIGAVIKAFEKNIKGVRHGDFLQIAKKVVASDQNRVYRYTRDLLKKLRSKNYYLLAISNSPREIVEGFCKKLGFHKVYGRIYEVGKGKKFTGKVNYAELITDKSKILQRAVEKEHLTLRNSIGVGDTENDVPFLKMVEKPICFNPNKRLYQYAKRAGWQIVVERKDMIYKI
ncbi:hypothetical protein A2926_02570 [Candidatus Giovannonibacteria bacterium RIFCSPLOWO2_01_FULL_44_40]|nr:MAG: hypothetical protein A3C77_02875 [Candidatus Giovannonibacteria bacterium RIFCSPHIGHO2_02_FULL_45_13]OGF79577.1 MAG: hypothetical protein A2926_02570 [Candidatus Giovannonibacteria bacterium RIFCSPLOWO2_01_FULL_44_40]